jgi:hypothetical protein
MEFPYCPACKNGQLLPLSSGDMGTYHSWVCHNPDCNYTIGSDLTYYKARAARKMTEKDGKSYAELDF